MDKSFSDTLLLASCFLIGFIIIGINLYRLLGSGPKETNTSEYEESLRHQKRKRIAAQKAEEAYLLLQREDINLKITYRHDSPKRLDKSGELTNIKRRNTSSGKQKITA